MMLCAAERPYSCVCVHNLSPSHTLSLARSLARSARALARPLILSLSLSRSLARTRALGNLKLALNLVVERDHAVLLPSARLFRVLPGHHDAWVWGESLTFTHTEG
jgi:hypothetical protein